MLSNSVSASDLDYNVTVKPSLKLTVSSNNLVLNLNPANHVFDSIGLNTTVSTNNENGYKLYLNSDTTNLVNTIDSTYTIPTLTSTVTDATSTNFPVNKWGYRISSGDTGDSTITSTTDYYPFVSNKLISQSALPTNGVSSTLDFATKIDYEKPAGQYNIALNFQALPAMSSYYMQDFAEDPTLKDTVCTETPAMVMDKRDGHTYAIAKLRDGKCWMVQNLQLGSTLDFHTGSMRLTSDDSNVISGSFILTNRRNDGDYPVMPNVRIDDDRDDIDGYIYDGSAFYCPYNGSIYATHNVEGCYYNWYTATAGLGTSSITNSTDVNSSICPKGWILPNGNPGGENSILNTKYSSVSELLVESPTTNYNNTNGVFRPGFILGGRVNDLSNGYGLGANGGYWARTGFSAARGRFWFFNNNISSPTDLINKYNGEFVRCLLQE